MRFLRVMRRRPLICASHADDDAAAAARIVRAIDAGSIESSSRSL